jgi:UDP-xylose/UDP-N-acetylglucosamine transporter B4
MTTSVTVNLVLSIRKFVSLFLSIYIFSNQFTTSNAVGVALVFVGTVMYAVSKSPDSTASLTVIGEAKE